MQWSASLDFERTPDMTRQITTSAVGIALMLTLFSGCLWAPELDRVRREIQQQLPGSSFKKEFAISLGPLSLALVRTIVRFVPEAEEARSYLSDIRSVEVAIYEADNLPADPAIDMPEHLETLLEKHDWEIAAKVRETSENVWLLYRAQEEVLEDLYVVVLSDDELVLVRARGNLDRLIAKAMREHVRPASNAGIPAY
jgi:hypothetical protein